MLTQPHTRALRPACRRCRPGPSCAVIIGTASLFVAITFSPLKSGYADAPDRGPGDVALYRAEIDRIHAGESYYSVAGDELRTRGYPTRSVFNWRTPSARCGWWPSCRTPESGRPCWPCWRWACGSWPSACSTRSSAERPAWPACFRSAEPCFSRAGRPVRDARNVGRNSHRPIGRGLWIRAPQVGFCGSAGGSLSCASCRACGAWSAWCSTPESGAGAASGMWAAGLAAYARLLRRARGPGTAADFRARCGPRARLGSIWRSRFRDFEWPR